MPIVSTPDGVFRQYVFVGGVVGFGDLATPSNTVQGRLTGNLGLYLQISAMFDASAARTIGGITQGMANTGSQEAELGLQHASGVRNWFNVYWGKLFSNYGLYPTEINAIIDYNPTSGGATLADFNTYVDVARSFGIETVAPIFSPNSSLSAPGNFASDAAYAGVRAAALYGGGLTIDAPPHYFFARSATYRAFAYQEIMWANQNNIRSTVIVSPNGDDRFFLLDTQKYVADLVSHGATPTEWVIENYNRSDANGIGSESSVNSIANVALYLAQSAPTSRPAGSLSFSPLPQKVVAPALHASVTVTATVHTAGIKGPIYVSVLSPLHTVESVLAQPISLDSNGDATFQVSLAQSGDSVRVEDNPKSPAFTAYSGQVTIVQPPASITLGSIGPVVESQIGAGCVVSETIHSANLSSNRVYSEVIKANGSVEQGWQTVALTGGTGTVTSKMLHTGDYFRVTDSQTNPTVFANSNPVVITDPLPPANISLSHLIQAQPLTSPLVAAFSASLETSPLPSSLRTAPAAQVAKRYFASAPTNARPGSSSMERPRSISEFNAANLARVPMSSVVRDFAKAPPSQVAATLSVAAHMQAIGGVFAQHHAAYSSRLDQLVLSHSH